MLEIIKLYKNMNKQKLCKNHGLRNCSKCQLTQPLTEQAGTRTYKEILEIIEDIEKKQDCQSIQVTNNTSMLKQTSNLSQTSLSDPENIWKELHACCHHSLDRLIGSLLLCEEDVKAFISQHFILKKDVINIVNKKRVMIIMEDLVDRQELIDRVRDQLRREIIEELVKA